MIMQLTNHPITQNLCIYKKTTIKYHLSQTNATKPLINELIYANNYHVMQTTTPLSPHRFHNNLDYFFAGDT